MNMKKILILLICLSMVAASLFVAEQVKKKKGSSKKILESEIKQEPREESADAFSRSMQNDMAAVEIRMQYMSKLRKINYEIQLEHINLKYNDKKRDIQYREELINDLAYRGRVPYSAEKKRDRIEDEEKYSNEHIKKLEMEKEDLKLDAIKYYKGTLPPEFSKEWNETESEHNEALTRIMNEP